ncbi:atlastin-1-like [Chironomus tepperi]|uniref:atlastin-1-like n=1 Tax=Chironomus tepperi TaxID=113505 RepID=UPI00391F9910
MASHQQTIKLITYSEKNDSVINTDQLTKIFGHETVKNRKIVAVLITGDDSEDKIKTLNSCLDLLYGIYPSLYQKNQSRWNDVASTPTSGTAYLEMWNDVFLHTSEVNDDEIAIVLMNIRGLFGPVVNNLYPNYCLKMFQLASIISSIHVINKSDFQAENRWTYLNLTCKLKQCFENKNKGINESSNDFMMTMNYLILKLGSKEFTSDQWRNMLLPHINQTVFVDFNKKPDQKILPFLHPDSLTIKEVNGLKITGSEFQQMIAFYHEQFQQSVVPEVKDIQSIIISSGIEIFIPRCIDSYNDFMVKNKLVIKSKDNTKVLHEIAMKKALSMLDDFNNKLGKFNSDRDVILATLEAMLNNIFEANQ